MLKPQDIYALVGLQVHLRRHAHVNLAQLSAFLRLSGSETHAALARLQTCQLLAATTMDLRKPLESNFLEFTEHGLRYVYPPAYGAPTRGIPTAASAVEGLSVPGPPLVWPLESGEAFGPSLAPLYRSVPEACAADIQLHLGMAALDCVRVGRPRERQAGMTLLQDLFGST